MSGDDFEGGNDHVRLVDADEVANRSNSPSIDDQTTAETQPIRPTQGVIRFPRESDLITDPEHRPILISKRDASSVLPQEPIIDIRDSADGRTTDEPEAKVAADPKVDQPLSGWKVPPGDEPTEPADGKTNTRIGPVQKAASSAKKAVPKMATEPGKGATRVPGGLNKASLTTRVLTGLSAAVVALAAFAFGPTTTLALVLVVLIAASVELFDGLRRVGYRPATLLGLVAICGVVLGAYARGAEAITAMTVLMVVFTLLWFLVGVSKAKPTINAAVTVFTFLWIGVLGSYAALLLRMPDRNGLAFLIGAVLATIAYDTGAYLGGSMLGRNPMAPSISPNKTWEGLIAGTVAAVLVGGLLVQAISPWNWTSGLLLGLLVSIFAPAGDLVESMVKRDLNIKDMGRLLPGHGGVLDRFDAMLFVLPATYYLVLILDLG